MIDPLLREHDMAHNLHRTYNRCAIALISLSLLPALAQAQTGLKTIDNPGGGQIVYGPLAGQTSLPQAMGAMLRQIHTHFGDRPKSAGSFNSAAAIRSQLFSR